MIGILDCEIQAANPQMPLYPLRAYVNSPSSVRLRNVPKKIGNWNITSVQIVAAYPDGSIKTANCVLTGGIWVGTIEGCAISGRSENGFTVFASGIDENGNPVSNYVLGKGLIEILQADGTITPDAPSYYVHLFDEEPEEPREGDMYPETSSSGYVIWQDGGAHPLGGIVDDELSTTSTNPVQNKVVTAAVNALPTKAQIDEGWWSDWVTVPSGPFQWTIAYDSDNGEWVATSTDGGFVIHIVSPDGENAVELSWGRIEDVQYTATRHRVAAPVPTKTSDLTNDSGFLTQHQQLTPVYSQTPTYSEWVCEPAEYDGIPFSVVDEEEEGEYWMLVWRASVYAQGYSDSTSLTWNPYGLPAVTATRTRTDIIGYTLGDQTDKPLQPKGDYQDALTDAQLAAINSGITSSKVSAYDGYASQITTAQDTATAANTLATTINGLVPPQASTSNQLADKAFVNSSVQTATANFRGNWATWNDVPTNANDYPSDYAGNTTPTVNDYMVVQDVVVEGNEGTWRYKYSGTWATDGKNGWLPEYQVNETPMTAAQLAAINSNITATKVAEYDEAMTRFNYALSTITPTAGDMYVLPSAFPMYHEEAEPFSVYPEYVTITYDSGTGKYALNDTEEGHPSPVCYINADGTFYSSGPSITDLIIGNQTPTPNVTQVAGSMPQYTLLDRTVNTISITSSNSTLGLTFPSANAGKARDFIVRVVASNGTYSIQPTFSISGATLMNADGEMPEIATDATDTKTTLFYFSEIASSIYLCKGEQLEAITL